MRGPAYEPSPQVKPVVHSPSDIKDFTHALAEITLLKSR